MAPREASCSRTDVVEPPRDGEDKDTDDGSDFGVVGGAVPGGAPDPAGALATDSAAACISAASAAITANIPRLWRLLISCSGNNAWTQESNNHVSNCAWTGCSHTWM